MIYKIYNGDLKEYNGEVIISQEFSRKKPVLL